MKLKMTEQSIVRNTFKITEKEMAVFASLSGDHNPLHQVANYAKAHRFRGRVVYGGLIISKISKLLGMQLPGKGWIWHTLSIQFKNPLYIEESVKMIGRVTYFNDNLGIVRLSVTLRKGIVGVAEAEVQAGRLKT